MVMNSQVGSDKRGTPKEVDKKSLVQVSPTADLELLSLL